MIINNTNQALESYVQTVVSETDDVFKRFPALEKVELAEQCSDYNGNLVELKKIAVDFFDVFKEFFSYGDLSIGLKVIIHRCESVINEKLNLVREHRFVGLKETMKLRDEIVDIITSDECNSRIVAKRYLSLAITLEVFVVALENSVKFIKEKIDIASKPHFQKICKEVKQASDCLVQLEELSCTMEEGADRDDVKKREKVIKDILKTMNGYSLKFNEYSLSMVQAELNEYDDGIELLVEQMIKLDPTAAGKIMTAIRERKSLNSIPTKIVHNATAFSLQRKLLRCFVEQCISTIIEKRAPKCGDDESTAESTTERLWGYDLPEGEEDRQQLISFEGEQVLLQHTKHPLPKL